MREHITIRRVWGAAAVLVVGMGLVLGLTLLERGNGRTPSNVSRNGTVIGLSSANPTQIPNEKFEALDLVADQLKQVGSFQTNGQRHDVFLGPALDGTMCLVQDQTLGTTPDGRPLRIYGKSCSPALLDEDHAVTFSIGSAGGGTTQTTSESVVGIARSDVTRIAIRDSQGKAHIVPLNEMKAFSFELPQGLVQKGVRMSGIVSYGDAGRELEYRAFSAS